ncbi:DHA2 family efflux MFS transporter permease subunit [Paenibacillus filicis]|uniref:DHA2 family efflux MFS transporter permease subunit n=2 Tax=Paenibacillus gyeongsangnamensis TaxID=3388067 RepID=A0ABT4QKA1_9BACL|nr:DHA2 family efflux MFS transporter permease subunit [Paenibacillus filicis]MCZ8517135.1 DHA2 family efflux MFS transporter permease subunit [Paenibacillus filicis]
MIALFFGSFLAILGISTINVALPVLMKDFNAGLDTVQWTLTGFMLATGVIAPVTGYLGDRFSTKYLYVGALVGFTLTSALCAFAWNIESLIAFRVLQGLFSGMVMPSTMTIIYQVIPRERQAFALSMWSLATMLAPAFGPTLAGWLIQTFNWEWLFLMNIPFGIAAIAVSLKQVPFYKVAAVKTFDTPGLITVVVCSTTLLIAFSEAHAWGWTSWKIVSLIALGLAALILFIRRELTVPQPLLNLRVFRYGKYTYSLILAVVITISLYSGTYLTPVYLQNIQHASALDTGLILLPASLAMAVFMPITGKLYARVGPVWLIAAGVLLIAVGTLAMGQLRVDTPHLYVVLWMTVRNIGISLSTMPATNAGMEIIPRELTGHASSVNNWIRQGFGSFSIGMFTSLLSARMAVHSAELSRQAGEGASPGDVQAHAFTSSVNDVYLAATIIVLIGMPLAWTLRPSRGGKPQPAKQAGTLQKA